MSGQPSSDHAADRTQVGEMNDVAILVADAELALSLDRGGCHRPSMWRALAAEERRPRAREGESLPLSLKERTAAR